MLRSGSKNAAGAPEAFQQEEPWVLGRLWCPGLPLRWPPQKLLWLASVTALDTIFLTWKQRSKWNGLVQIVIFKVWHRDMDVITAKRKDFYTRSHLFNTVTTTNCDEAYKTTLNLSPERWTGFKLRTDRIAKELSFSPTTTETKHRIDFW